MNIGLVDDMKNHSGNVLICLDIIMLGFGDEIEVHNGARMLGS